MALGGFFGAFANMLGGLATSDIQRSDNEYLMNRQAELNKEQADYSTNLAKNYWDYTNYENSVKHAGKEISGEILNWIMRGGPKTITEITSRLEELFDDKGNKKVQKG